MQSNSKHYSIDYILYSNQEMSETDHECQNISKEGEIRVDLRIKKIFLEKVRLLWGIER